MVNLIFIRSSGGKLVNAMLLDFSIVLIYIIFAFTGFRSGIIRSFLTLINSIFSSIASLYCSKLFSHLAYDYYFKPSIVNYLINVLPECNFNTKDALGKIPHSILNVLGNSGITLSDITHIISNVGKENSPEKIVEIFRPVVIEFTRSISSSIFFILFMSIGRLIINLILKISKLGAIRKIGKVIGSIFGILKGYIIISIFMCFLKVIMPYCSSEINDIFSFENISSTMIFKHMYINNPIYEIFEKMNNT